MVVGAPLGDHGWRGATELVIIRESHQNESGLGVPIVAQRKQILLVSMRMQVQSLASFSGSGIWHCCELWCRLQMGLRSGIAVAVAVASSCSSLTWEHPYAACVALKSKEKKNRIIFLNRMIFFE